MLCTTNRIIKDKLDKVKVFIQVDDGAPQLECAENYEQIISSNEPMERFERSEDNIYMLYTGGTTGMPKGVMYTHGGHLGAMFNTAGAWGMIPIQEKIEIEKLLEKIEEDDDVQNVFHNM